MHLYVSWSSSHKCPPLTRDIPSHVFQEGKQYPAFTKLNNIHKGRSSELRKSGYVTENSSTGEVSAECPYISLRQGHSKQLFAIICQTEKSVYAPKSYLFHARSFCMIQPLRDNWLFSFCSCHFMLLMRRSRLCLSEKALINSLWRTCSALNRRQANAVSVSTGALSS